MLHKCGMMSGITILSLGLKIKLRKFKCRTRAMNHMIFYPYLVAQQTMMSFMIEKSSKGNKQRPAKFIAPGHLARARIYGQKTSGIVGDSKGGISTHTLTLHFGEEKLQDSDFTEDCCYLDILKMCIKLIDVESVGFDVTNGDGRKLKNDKDVLAMLEEHEFVENTDIYLDINEAAKPLHFKLPQDKMTFDILLFKWLISKVPEVRKVSILGKYKSNERVTVKGDVMNRTEEASTVEFFITKDKHLSINSDLLAISECMTSKEFQVPKEAEGHYLVAKFTPKSDKGKSGKPRYVMTDNHVQDSTSQKARKVRGKNKNTKIAMLNSGEKLEIEFYNNHAVGKNHTYWSRHLGKIVRNKHICPVRVQTWKDITNADKLHIWDAVKLRTICN